MKKYSMFPLILLFLSGWILTACDSNAKKDPTTHSSSMSSTTSSTQDDTSSTDSIDSKAESTDQSSESKEEVHVESDSSSHKNDSSSDSKTSSSVKAPTTTPSSSSSTAKKTTASTSSSKATSSSKPASSSTATTSKTTSTATKTTTTQPKTTTSASSTSTPASKPAPTPAATLVSTAQAKAMLRSSGLFRDNGNIFLHATTVEGIAPAPSVEIVFGGGHIATLFLDGVNYTALLPSDVADRPDLKKDTQLTRTAVKKATDAVFGAGTSASQELYTVIIQKGSLVDFPAFTKTIGGHTISFDQEGGVYVVIH